MVPLPRLIAARYSSRRPVRAASSVAMSVRSRVSTGGATTGWRRAQPAVLPVLLDVLGAADPVELERLEVGGLGQEQIRVPVGLVLRVGEGGDEGEALELLLDATGVPVGDRRVRPVDDPDVGHGRRRPVLGRTLHEEPRQVRGAERGGPRRVVGQRDQRAVGVADVGRALPLAPLGRVERLLHEAVAARASPSPGGSGRAG